MTYSTDDAIKKIVDFKKQWEDANNSGDLVAKGNAEKYAKKVYEMMRANGDSAIADELSASDFTKAQQVRDTYYKMGKTETRPYLYGLGAKYGMSQSDVDAAIGWDESTGEISLGGKKIGRPDALVGGSSYWKDTSVLDNAFSDYVSRTGKTMPTSTTVSTGNEDVMEKYKKTFETAMNENPYETEVGKSIMGKYNLAAIQGRENQLASGAATNGGNIDSFSAANAMRQQASLIYQGQDAALTAHQQKIDNAQKILEGMGVHINRMFEQGETAKNNEVSRNVAKSEVTGYVPNEWTYDNNIYLNSDGTVREEYLSDEFDATGGFTTIINDAKAKLATTTDAAERENLQATINAATQAKALKTFSSPKYAKYAHEVTATTPQETADVKQANADRESAENIVRSENDTTLALAEQEAESAIDQIEAQVQGEKEILEESAKYTGNPNNDYAAYDYLLSAWEPHETVKRAFVEKFIKPIYEGEESITPEGLKQLIMANTEQYNLDVDDAREICRAFKISDDWLDDYRDRTDADGETKWGREGRYGGMIRK